MSVGCIFVVILAAKFYRVMSSEKGVMSIPEAYKNIFEDRSRTVLLIIVVIVYGILYSSQPVAAASIIAPMIGSDVTVTALVISAIFILVTLFGGMKGIAWMNVVHSAVMFIGMFIVMFKSVGSVGGVAAMQAALPQNSSASLSLMFPLQLQVRWEREFPYSCGHSCKRYIQCKKLKSCKMGNSYCGYPCYTFCFGACLCRYGC
jgi:Na+/proline symporter